MSRYNDARWLPKNVFGFMVLDLGAWAVLIRLKLD